MPGIVQELDLILNQAMLGKTVADAKKAGADIGNAIGNAPAVKDAAHKLGEAISTELKKAAESTKMDMASLASASGPLRQAVNPMTAAMSAAAVATSSLGTASTGAAPGLKMAEKAIFNLAAQAASAPGPIGKLAEAFLTFGAGGPIAVGVAATLGAVILALGSIKGAADKATESLRKMNDQFAAQQAGKAGAIAQIDVQINDLKTHIKESQQSLAELLNRASAFGAVGGAAAEVGLFGKQFKEAKAEIDRARASLKQLQQERDALFAASAFGSETAGHFSSSLSFHKSKDPGRLRTNEQMFQRAMNGDTEALEFLRTHSVVSQNGSVGWGSQEAATDAHNKYMEAKGVQDAAGQPARDAANAQHDAEIAAAQKQAALDQQRATEQGAVLQHQAQADMDHRAKVFKDANRLGLGQAAANTGVLFNAAAIAGQGALGHDSPLYVEARTESRRCAPRSGASGRAGPEAGG
jgi:hypothetical protein